MIGTIRMASARIDESMEWSVLWMSQILFANIGRPLRPSDVTI
ncbi:hypothetical protein GGD62_005664 [Bradyrhizobium sp. ERR14]|nr:hypothetical protein [Bradyrhizobium sp. ERR14]